MQQVFWWLQLPLKPSTTDLFQQGRGTLKKGTNRESGSCGKVAQATANPQVPPGWN